MTSSPDPSKKRFARFVEKVRDAGLQYLLEIDFMP
jgi:hypothetical protein